jgi:hypothetical protein
VARKLGDSALTDMTSELNGAYVQLSKQSRRKQRGEFYLQTHLYFRAVVGCYESRGGSDVRYSGKPLLVN